MPAAPAPKRLHRLVVARRNRPCRGLSLGLGSERPTPAGLLARGSRLDARLPRLPQWLIRKLRIGASCSPLTVAGTASASGVQCELPYRVPILSPFGHRRDLRGASPARAAHSGMRRGCNGDLRLRSSLRRSRGEGDRARRAWWRGGDGASLRKAAAPPSALCAATSPWLRHREDFQVTRSTTIAAPTPIAPVSTTSP